MIKTLKKIEAALVKKPKHAERDAALRGLRTAMFHIGNLIAEKEPTVEEPTVADSAPVETEVKPEKTEK